MQQQPRKDNIRSNCEEELTQSTNNQKVNINVRFCDINSNSDFKSANSTTCNSDAMGFANSSKTTSKEMSNSPISGLALRNLGKSVDDSDDEDDLERLLNEAGEDDDEFELIQNPCNGFEQQDADISKTQPFQCFPNAAQNMQGQFALCSSEAVGNQARPAPLICVGLTEKQEIPELNIARSQSQKPTMINTSANKTLGPKVTINLRPLLPAVNVSKPQTTFNLTVPKNVIKIDQTSFASKPITQSMSPEKQGSIINVEEMEDLLADLENDDDSDSAGKIVLAKFDTTEQINEEFKPMGYGSRNDQIYPDDEVLDYYESSSDDELSMDEDDLSDTDVPLPPPVLNGGLLRRHNAAIFMPIRVNSLYG